MKRNSTKSTLLTSWDTKKQIFENACLLKTSVESRSDFAVSTRLLGVKTNSLPKLLKYHRFFKPIHFPKEWILHLLRFPKKGIPICGLNHLRGKNRLSNEKTLAVHGTYGITLASYTRWYVGIIISLLSHHKDPYEKTSIYTVMENQRVLFVAHFKRWGHPKTHPKNFKKNHWHQRTPQGGSREPSHFIPDQSVLVGGFNTSEKQ